LHATFKQAMAIGYRSVRKHLARLVKDCQELVRRNGQKPKHWTSAWTWHCSLRPCYPDLPWILFGWLAYLEGYGAATSDDLTCPVTTECWHHRLWLAGIIPSSSRHTRSYICPTGFWVRLRCWLP